MYSWTDVAMRTEVVYKKVKDTPNSSLSNRLLKYNECGAFAGILGMMIVVVDLYFYVLLEYLFPREEIDLAPKFDSEYWKENCRSLM
jgi:phosphatidylinositol N-acetylglucosaminyltransferase subunit A